VQYTLWKFPGGIADLGEDIGKHDQFFIVHCKCKSTNIVLFLQSVEVWFMKFSKQVFHLKFKTLSMQTYLALLKSHSFDQ
jgi:hypothetical protein